MRFMAILKATKESEAGAMPSQEAVLEMGKFNEELVKAGVLLSAEGLHPSTKGTRVKVTGKKRIVIDGPFTESKELVAGFWILQVRSREEAIEWVKRMPTAFPDRETEIEVRQVIEWEDLGDDFTPELQAQEKAIDAAVAAKKK